MIPIHKVFVKSFSENVTLFGEKEEQFHDVTVNCTFLVMINGTVNKEQLHHVKSDLSDLRGSTAFVSPLSGYQDCRYRRPL